MDIALFGRGLLFGLAIASSVGPISLLCIQRTLTYGRLTGLVTGMGAASADAIYGLIAGLGVTAVATFLSGQRLWLGLIGGLFLCYLGARTFLSAPAEQAAKVEMRGGLWRAYLSTFLLTLTNPLTIFSFMAAFAGLGLAAGGATGNQGVNAGSLVAGVFCGSALWWIILTSIVSLLRSWINTQTLMWINRVSGVILVGFGGYLLLDLMR
jgi:threonine/homoserine/homoserine lactone efflux protein